jgi:AcrR family transcriptional regulator
MLYVRSTQPLDDFTARARIRDAAIDCFAATGFGATVRQIAARAGVSPGLVTHHFGSKDALRAECDAEVLRRVLELKEDGIRRPPGEAIARIALLDGYGATFGYTLRSVGEGGEAGRRFLQDMIEDARAYTADAVAMGRVLPSADPDARVTLLVTQSIGGMLLQLNLLGQTDYSDGVALMHLLTERTTFPILELYTQGLLTDSTLLDEYVKQMPQVAPASTKASN